MHKAFEIHPLLEWRGLPFQIESIDTWEKKLLIGTSKGQVLLYEVQHKDGRYSLSIKETKKNFSEDKKPILQLAVVEEFNLLLSLSHGYVHVHDLTTLQPLERIESTNGSRLFAVDVQLRSEPQADTHRRSGARKGQPARNLCLRLCAAVKRKLLTFEWTGNRFVKRKELVPPDGAKTVVWCGRSLCVGFKKDYNLINEETGDTSEIFKTGQNQEPLACRIPGNEILLGKDNISIFVGMDCKPVRSYGISWSEVPKGLELVAPYVVALLPKSVEVRTIDTVRVVQNLDLAKAKFIVQNDAVYIASPSTCWRLEPVALRDQIKELLQQDEFEDALILADMIDEDPARKAARVAEIKHSYALSEFAKKNFDHAIKLFLELGIDPPYVIGLYPDFLPANCQNDLNYPIEIPGLNDAELEMATKALIEYLTQKRVDFSKLPEDRRVKELQQIVDTTLLKCYLQTNPALASSLLRVSNRCHLAESEEMLKKANRYNELVDLYKSRGKHEEALELMKQRETAPIIISEYLQRLGVEHKKLIFTFAPYVFSKDPEEGFAIFTSDDYQEIRTLPQEEVAEFLEKHHPEHLVPYLEHIIFKWKTSRPYFHNRLILAYLDHVQEPMLEYIASLKGSKPAPLGEEPGPLGKHRQKLYDFLDTSQHYEATQLITRFMNLKSTLFEERAILHGRIGNHDEALRIFAHVLRDPHQAEMYCLKHYNKDTQDGRMVYVHLLQVYMQPPNGIQPNIPAALRVLSTYHECIDTKVALNMIPSHIKVASIHEFLVAVMRDRAKVRRNTQLLRSLRKSERLQVHQDLLSYQDRRVVITDDKLCYVCRRKIQTKAFYYYPNGIVAHVHCCKDPNICPCTDPKCELKHDAESDGRQRGTTD